MSDYDDEFINSKRIPYRDIELSKALNAIATSIKYLGNGNAASEMGAIENLAKELKEGSERIADALNAIATAIRSKII